MDKLRELEIEMNYIRWRKSECIYKSEWEKAALLREKEHNLLSKLEHIMGSEYIKSNYFMIRFEGKYYDYPLPKMMKRLLE